MNIKPEDVQAFMANLPQGGGPEEDIPPVQQDQAMQEGAAMAEADIAAQEADASGAPGEPIEGQPPAPAAPAAPAAPVVPEAVTALGFSTPEDMAAAYEQLSQQTQEMREQLEQIVAMQQAIDTEETLDPKAPDYMAKKTFREMMGPFYDKLKTEARNKLVQGAWAKDAAGMPDLDAFNADISEFFRENPALAVDTTGLRQAYHAARSKKFRSEDQLFGDPEFIKKAASNKAIADAVMKAQMLNVAGTGDVPQGVDGGGIPLTGKKQAPKTIKDANAAVRALLGG